MTGKDYQEAYQSAPAGRQTKEAHRVLIGAERAVAKIAAPNYYGNMGTSSLVSTGDYVAYYAAFAGTQLDSAEVMELAPPHA